MYTIGPIITMVPRNRYSESVFQVLRSCLSVFSFLFSFCFVLIVRSLLLLLSLPLLLGLFGGRGGGVADWKSTAMWENSGS